MVAGLTKLPHVSEPETLPKVTPVSNEGGYYVPPEYASEIYTRMSWSGVSNSSINSYVFYSLADTGHGNIVYKGSTDNPPLP